jgi:peptidoglycan/LPS O-acetylase OafA/YrhL
MGKNLVQADRVSERVKLDALTSIRFFLSAMVVISHFTGRFVSELGPLPGFAYNMAPLAVSWFFVLSGFIIAYNYPELATNKQRRDFSILRVARLWPVHCVVLTAAVFFLYVTKNGYLLRHENWLFYQYTLTQSWSLNADIAQGYNGPAWSISCEFFFYIAYIALVAPWRWLRIFVAAGAMMGAMLPLMYGQIDPGAVGTATYNYFVFEFPPSRLIEFAAGVALCRFKIRVPQAVGLVAAGVVFAHPVANMAMREILIVIGGGALIASLAREGWLSRLLSFPLLVIGGEISYSIYMVHEVINPAILPHIKGLGLLETFIIVTSATLLASVLLFYFVETPCRDFVKSRLKPRERSLSLATPVDTMAPAA